MKEKYPHEIEYRRQAFKLFEYGISTTKILKRFPARAHGSLNGNILRGSQAFDPLPKPLLAK